MSPRLIVFLCVTTLLSPTLRAQKPALIEPGDYVTEGGWGTLILRAGEGGALHFTIESVGANGHSCSLEGNVRNGKVALETDDDEGSCTVTMVPTAQGIEVGGNDGCRFYCGARARFEGTYLPLAPACTTKAVARTRAKFKQLYDDKRFSDARATLEPLLEKCAITLDGVTTGRIRNDLAVTLHKLGDLAGCRAVLLALTEDASKTDEELSETLPPFDAEMYLPIIHATRTNLKLCREKPQ